MRVFEVPRAGRPVGHRARVPAARPLHGRAARARRRRRRRRVRRRPADVRVRHRRQLPGPHRGQRALRAEPADRRHRRPRAGHRRAVDVVVGPAARGARGRRRRGAGPRRCSTASAPTPRRRTIAAVAAGAGDRRRPPHRRRCSPATTSWPRRSATTSTRPAGEWRFRVYRRGAPGGAVRAAAAARPPRRCRRSTSSPYTFRLGDRAGLPLRHRRARRRRASASTSSAGAALQEAFARRSSPATIEGDGFNRLVLRAGLSAREVDDRARPTASTCARSGSPSARRYIEDTLAAPPALVADLVGAVPRPLRPGRRRCRRRSATGRRQPPSSSGSSTRSTPSRASTTTASAGRSSR